MSHVQSTVRVPSEGNTFHPITSEDLSRCSGQTSHYIVEELNESGRQTSERRISTLGAKTAQLYSDLLHDVQWEPFTAQNSQHGVRLHSCIQTYSMMYSGNRSQLTIPVRLHSCIQTYSMMYSGNRSQLRIPSME